MHQTRKCSNELGVELRSTRHQPHRLPATSPGSPHVACEAHGARGLTTWPGGVGDDISSAPPFPRVALGRPRAANISRLFLFLSGEKGVELPAVASGHPDTLGPGDQSRSVERVKVAGAHVNLGIVWFCPCVILTANYGVK